MLHTFAQFELDEERFELRRDGRAVRVEPRVLEVLAYLIRNRGRVVAKEELLDQVWKKSFVSDSALTRCIMEARRAIGDPSLITTVHGRGYWFDAMEEERPVTLSRVDGEGSHDATTGDWKRRRLIVAGFLLFILTTAWLWTRRGTQAAPREGVTIRVALLPIAMNENDRELQMAGMSIADLLEQRLGKIAHVRVRGADYSRPISVTAPNLAELARRAGVEYVISGSLTPGRAAERARLVLVLHHIRPGGTVRDAPLGSFSVPLLHKSGDISQYAALRDRVVSRVVATVLPALKLGPGGALTPRDPESYRLYLLARERLANGGCDGEAAIELLRRSLEIDDRFAPAWNAYAWALYRLAGACTEGSRHHRRTLEAADRALALSPSMGSALTLKARVMAETGRVDEAYRLVRDALRDDPENIDLHRAHAALLAQTGFLDAARTHLQRVTSADPNHLGEHGVLATPYLYAGDLPRFLESLPESDAPRFRYARGFAELMQGRADAAYRTLEPSFRSNPADAHARLSHALLAVIEGRHDEARAIVRHFVRQRELVRETDPEMTYRIAQLAALAGDDALALRQLERAIQQGFFCVAWIERDPALVSIRGTSRYADLLALARRSHDAFAKRFELRAAH